MSDTNNKAGARKGLRGVTAPRPCHTGLIGREGIVVPGSTGLLRRKLGTVNSFVESKA